MTKECLEKQFPIGPKIAIIFSLKIRVQKKVQGKYKSTNGVGKQIDSVQGKKIRKNESITETNILQAVNIVREQDGGD